MHHLIWFKKDKVQALITSSSEVNAIILIFATKLDFKICSTNIWAQKIDGSTLKTFKMAKASFQIEDKLAKSRFF